MTIRKLTDEMWEQFTRSGEDRDRLVVELQELWKRELPSLPVPDERQFQRWLRGRTDPDALIYAMVQAKRRMVRHSWTDPTHHILFISSVNNKRVAETRQQAEMKRAA
jgi:hypothetical protein